MDNYSITVPAAEDPITLTEVKDWLRISGTADDELIKSLIVAATQRLEVFTNRRFVKRTMTGEFDCLKYSTSTYYPYIQIRKAPVLSVTTVEVDEGSGFVATTDFQLRQTNDYPDILFTDTPVPDLSVQAYPIKVTFIAGYGNHNDVPDAIQTAIKMYTAFLYENRGDTAPIENQGVPLEVRLLLSAYRIMNTF